MRTLFMTLLLFGPQAWAEPSPAVAKAVEQGIRGFNSKAVFELPTLTPDQVEDLEKGKVLKIVERSKDRAQPARALAFFLSDHSQAALWVASLDPHLTVDPDLIEKKLADHQGKEVWYGYYKLPYPFSDRHWVIESWNNLALATATQGASWEHAWKLAPSQESVVFSAVRGGAVDGVDAAAVDSAVKTPHNHGAWLVIRLENGRSLLGYHATSTVGGSVPDWVVLQLVHGKLDALLKRVNERCTTLVPEHYNAAHPHIEGGDGAPLTWRP